MNAAALFSTAQSLFGGSKLAGSYNIASNPGHASGSGSGTADGEIIGLWTVQRATHKTNGKTVSIWTLDKNALGTQGTTGGSRYKGKIKLDPTLEVLKKEISTQSRLRHPCVLEVVEALEETRSSLTFATEPVSSSLRNAILASERSSSYSSTRRGSSNSNVADVPGELDEIEIQKGLLQIGKALQFLHESAKLVHSNLTPNAIVINAKGDWKLSGFGLSTYLTQPNGDPSRWEHPSFDRQMPAEVQKDLDYMAPEYALDETLLPANDMYSLGCIIFAIHTKAGPPFSNRHSIQNLRDNMENLVTMRATWHKLPDEVQDVLSQLLTRYPSGRMSAAAFQASRYFSSTLVSTLRYLDRDSFAAKPREEQASFLKGLLKVLPQFSDKVIKRKILPSLLEETRKNMLVPFLLPCIFYIGQKMEKEEFRDSLLTDLKPLFSMKDPPQVMLTLLDNLAIFHEKCNAVTFREDVLPLVYNALDSDVPTLLEKALKVIPSLSETLDYTTVKSMLLPKITNVFSKTTSLAVKVTTLICFKSLVPILDKFTLTENLVPLLARIKTKEPSVMIATLAVHEQIGLKCDIQAIATLVLPQLWAMSITPLLSAEQFTRFMGVIKQLGTRVELEHSKHLQEIKRLEESSGGVPRGAVRMPDLNGNEEVDFEALVRGKSSNGMPGSVSPDPFGNNDDFARFDAMSTSTTGPTSGPSATNLSPSSSSSGQATASRNNVRAAAPTHSTKAASILGARPISANAFNTRSNFAVTPDTSAPATPVMQAQGGYSINSSVSSIATLPPPLQPPHRASPAVTTSLTGSSYASSKYAQSNFGPMLAASLQPSASSSGGGMLMPSIAPTIATATAFAPMIPTSSSFMSPMQPTTKSVAANASPSPAIQWNNAAMPPSTASPQSVLQPVQWQQPQARPAQNGFSSAILQPTKKETTFDWSDLDPMR